MGMVGRIEFRRYPRILLNHFFSPPSNDSKAAPTKAKLEPMVKIETQQALPKHSDTLSTYEATLNKYNAKLGPATLTHEVQTAAASLASLSVEDSTRSKALQLIANEAGLDLEDLESGAQFSDLGIDSLMSLVISEKLRKELDVKVGGSLFLDYPTIGDLSKWLDEYYS